MSDPQASGFRDHFAAAAGAYARHRPHYPDALFAWVARASPAQRRVWDCGTGSGQAAVALAGHFDMVLASDASRAQLATAARHPRVHYVAAVAELAPIGARAVDAIVVAQALHWFARDRFFAEARRVLAPGGLLAVWTYGHGRTGVAAVDAVLRDFEREVAPWWPVERALVDAGYADIALPFAPVEAPSLALAHRWTAEDLAGYLGTWSATLRRTLATGDDPMPALRTRLRDAWGEPGARVVRWPLTVLAGRAD